MRPIKFRGRDIDTGEFVYGNLLSTVFGTYIYDARGITFNPCDCCMVKSESVAQLVGYDSAGNEVYEGDKVIGKFGYEDVAEIRVYPVLNLTKLKEAAK